MSYQGQDPNQQGQYPNSGQYGGSNPQPQPTDPYSGQQYGQQAPYGQQQYGQQYGQQAPYGQQPSGSTSSGLSPNVAAGVSYIFGWITGLIFLLTEKQNKFVRFNAMQSFLLSAAISLIDIVLGVFLRSMPVSISLAFSGLQGIAGLVFLAGWIICMVNAFQGKTFKLPYVGDVAQRYVDTGVFKL